MKYIEFKVHASRQGVEQLTAMFMSKGIYELSIKDPADMEDILDKKASYEWDYVDDSLRETVDKEPVVSVYFEDTPENRERISWRRSPQRLWDFGACASIMVLNWRIRLPLATV